MTLLEDAEILTCRNCGRARVRPVLPHALPCSRCGCKHHDHHQVIRGPLIPTSERPSK